MKDDRYIFVIDTDSYAGNFKREMCAYLTGQIGDCGVGQSLQDIAIKELNKEVLEKFDDIIMQVPDDHGNFRPCSIWKSPKTKIMKYSSYNSVAIFFSERPSFEMIAVMKERAYKFADAFKEHGRMAEFNKDFKLEIENFRLICEKTIEQEEKI